MYIPVGIRMRDRYVASRYPVFRAYQGDMILVVSVRAVEACGEVEVWLHVFLSSAVRTVSGQFMSLPPYHLG
jgi:hypothetical protein